MGQSCGCRQAGRVLALGKKPRLIGDGSISGANAASRVLEKVRLPSLHAVQRFMCVPTAVPSLPWPESGLKKALTMAAAGLCVVLTSRRQGCA